MISSNMSEKQNATTNIIRIRDESKLQSFMRQVERKTGHILDGFRSEWNADQIFATFHEANGNEVTLAKMKELMNQSWASIMIHDYVHSSVTSLQTKEYSELYKTILDTFSKVMTNEIRRIPDFNELDSSMKYECTRMLKSLLEEKFTRTVKSMILDLIYDYENGLSLVEMETSDDDDDDDDMSTGTGSEYVPSENESSSSSSTSDEMTEESSDDDDEEYISDIVEDDNRSSFSVSDDDDDDSETSSEM